MLLFCKEQEESCTILVPDNKYYSSISTLDFAAAYSFISKLTRLHTPYEQFLNVHCSVGIRSHKELQIL